MIARRCIVSKDPAKVVEHIRHVTRCRGAPPVNPQVGHDKLRTVRVNHHNNHGRKPAFLTNHRHVDPNGMSCRGNHP